MVDYKYADLFEKDNVEKQWIIDYGDGVITNENLDTQSIELTESLCSESELRFGCCESNCLKFKCSGISVSLTGKWITVSIILDSHKDAPFIVGTYKVESDKLTADRMHREIVAYDSMRDIINRDFSSWYKFIFREESSEISMRGFRIAFAVSSNVFFKEQSLINDEIILKKTIEPENISGLDILSAICEINGCFCRINREGKLEYVYLKQGTMGLYPSETLYPGHAPDYLPQAKSQTSEPETWALYPQEPDSFEIKRSCCASCQYEDYIVKPITKLQIRQSEDDIGCVYPEGEISEDDNCYIIEDNFLVYGKGLEELARIAANIFGKITDIVYRPFSAEVRGNLCVETGDAVRISTKYDIVESYIMNRTMKGGHGLMGSISSKGAEKYSEKVNSVNRSIIQLKGKTNTLERNAEETILKIGDVETSLSSRIGQTVKSIEMSVSNDKTGKTAEVKLLITDEGGTQYEVTADKIDFSGLVSFGNLKKDGETIINGGNITTGKINCDRLNGGKIQGQTFYGGKIQGANIEGEKSYYLHEPDFDTRYKIISFKSDNSSDNDLRFGRLSKNDVETLLNYISFKDESSDRTFHIYSDRAFIHCALDVNHIYSDGEINFYCDGKTNGVRAYSDNFHYMLSYNPKNNYTYVGMPVNSGAAGDYKTSTRIMGNSVVIESSGAAVTSDERLKNSFKPLDEFDAVYMDIESCAFKYNNGSSGRYHFGAKAQGVKEAFEKHGYTTQDFGGFVQMQDNPESEDYCGVEDPMGLIYTEFTMWNMHMIQKLYKKVEKQQEEIENMKELISSVLRTDGENGKSI